jgi:hypothetical protein
MISKIREFIDDNQTSALFIALSVIFVAVVMSAQGCDVKKMIKVDAPRAVVVATAETPEDVDRDITLAEAEDIWADWQTYVKSNTERYQRAVKDANDRYVIISSMIDLGLEQASGPLSTIPGGAVVLSLLTGAAGLFLRRPGDTAVIAKEKEASYNAGIDLGVKIVKTEEPKS